MYVLYLISASTSTSSTALQSEIQLTSFSVEENNTVEGNNENLEITYREGTKPINAARNKFVKLNAQLKVKLLKLREKCKNLNQKVRQAAKISESKAFLKAVEKLPEPAAIFTNMQLKKAYITPRGRRFKNQEKILCLTIYKQSQKGYKLLQRLFALPSIRTIQKILSKVTIKPGINDVVMEHLKKAVNKLPLEKKLCTLIFDEVALRPGLYYNTTDDEIIGFEDFGPQKTEKIADHALVFMIKSLKGKYKQPIAFTFCQSATKSTQLKKLIQDILKAIQSTGLKVIATVCDQSSTNMSVIKSLINDTKRKYLLEGKEFKSLSFEYNGSKIFPVFDPPHLLKGLRNNLLTKNLRFIQNGVVKFAKWEHLQMLLDADPGEDDIRLVNKLTESHVVPEKIPKMKVKHAAQVFSQRVSATMRYLANHDILPKECICTADLLLLVDKLFNSFNGFSYESSHKTYKCALRRNSAHFKLWEELLPIIRSMQFRVEKKLRDGTTSIKFEQVPSIQNGISNINVFKEMFSYLNNIHNITSLLTRNINQDPLENFFCNIRSNGVRNTSPTCSQFTSAFKTLLINNLTSSHSIGANCEQDDNKALKPLKSLLNYTEKKSLEQPSDNVNVDSVITRFMQTSDIEYNNATSKEAKRYVAGYIIKKIFQKKM
ncbi:unnamed protein product [Arctia plantaginis]|uniref:Transposase n=1 Tax=Arctia plantaginis TaxID=874455 RepID=A0A8S1BLP1_ARCPL|nr:unnamed protein product [Arctia plantaginis]